jgi:hypothetical protein
MKFPSSILLFFNERVVKYTICEDNGSESGNKEKKRKK